MHLSPKSYGRALTSDVTAERSAGLSVSALAPSPTLGTLSTVRSSSLGTLLSLLTVRKGEIENTLDHDVQHGATRVARDGPAHPART